MRDRSGGETKTRHYVTVAFTVDGTEYEGLLDHYSSGMHIGDEATVYYNPNNLDDFVGDGGIMLLLIPCLGGLFVVIGLSLVIKEVKTAHKIKRLKTSGRKEIGTITNFTTDYSISVNNRHPHKFECTVDNFRGFDKKIYNSHNVYWDNPEMYIGMTVDVYINRENPDEYAVDMESIRTSITN